jgi:hypothetical protein
LITLSRKQVQKIRSVFRRGLGVTARSQAPAVVLAAAQESLSVRTQNGDVAIEHRTSGEFQPETLVIPFRALADCEGGRDHPVAFRQEGVHIIAEWSEAGIPQVVRFDPEEAPPFPAAPDRMESNPAGLMPALRAAVETADEVESRFAINCLRLRGKRGQIASTDSRQLLLQEGFKFPWKGDLLIPAARVLLCSDFAGQGETQIGRTEDWIALRSGPWTVYLRIAKEKRFPKVEHVVPDPSRAIATLRLSDAAAEFLGEALKHLPAAEELHSPVTLDLNGHVAIRAKAQDQAKFTEVLLTGANHSGQSIRVSANRHYLAWAAAQGFREFYFFGGGAPACCKDERRTFVWVPLESDPSAAEGENAPAESAVSQESVAEPNAEPERPISPTPAEVDGDSRAAAPSANGSAHPNGSEPVSIEEVIRQSEQLKQTLRQAQTQLGELVSALKLHRRRSRLVRSTLASLRQLQTIDA